MVVFLAVGLGTREPGSMEQTLRLVEGLVSPEQAEKTDRQTHIHSNTKLHSHPGSGVG